MDYTISVVLSFLIAVPAVIGCIRLKNIDATWCPFVFCLVAGLLNEIISFVLITSGRPNTIVYSIYGYVESALLIWQFALWRNNGKATVYWLLFFCITVFRVVSFNGVLDGGPALDSYFIISYSFIIVVLGVNRMNKLIVATKDYLLKNPAFLICIGLVMFYSYSIMVEIFWLYGLDASASFSARVYDILAFINLTVNFIFTLAVIWIPNKQKFILQSS